MYEQLTTEQQWGCARVQTFFLVSTWEHKLAYRSQIPCIMHGSRPIKLTPYAWVHVFVSTPSGSLVTSRLVLQRGPLAWTCGWSLQTQWSCWCWKSRSRMDPVFGTRLKTEEGQNWRTEGHMAQVTAQPSSVLNWLEVDSGFVSTQNYSY